MSPQQIMDRCLCLLIGAPYSEFKNGSLHQVVHPYGGSMEEAFYGLLDTIKCDEDTMALEGKKRSLIITSDREDRNGGGVNGLRRKVEDYEPDMVVVDAVYLMRNDRSGIRSVKWSDQAAISQDLKEVAQDYKRPVIATLQANRPSEIKKGESAANMAFSDSYAQDCDLGIEIIKKRIDDTHNELALVITAREANLAGFAIHGDPCTNFGILEKPVTDKHGTVLKNNGVVITAPVIFHDVTDVWKMFKREDVDEVRDTMTDVVHDMMTPKKNKKGKNSA
jgi:hypothetical protein